MIGMTPCKPKDDSGLIKISGSETNSIEGQFSYTVTINEDFNFSNSIKIVSQTTDEEETVEEEPEEEE